MSYRKHRMKINQNQLLWSGFPGLIRGHGNQAGQFKHRLKMNRKTKVVLENFYIRAQLAPLAAALGSSAD